VLIKHKETCDKYWSINSPKVVEVMILLDLIEDMNSNRIDN